ncbi:hypothetical protein NEIG_00242 [Nematocida sp. ERTm5]|nr:hypothetical protein NEIG_00242 [Nematocida sp. ERTm5]
MTNYINEQVLRDKIEKEFIDKEGQVGLNETDKLFNILADINRERRIFTEIPEELVNLAYNIFYIKLFDRVMDKPISNYKDIIISEANESIKSAGMIINTVIKTANQLKGFSIAKGFYNCIKNNPIIMAAGYKIRQRIFNSFINTLCEKEGIPELDDKITKKEANTILAVFEKSKLCCRAQTALHIVMKHCNVINITDENQIKQLSADGLGISRHDIETLQLFQRANPISGDEFLTTLNNDDDCIKPILYNSLHTALFNIFTNKNLHNPKTKDYTDNYMNETEQLLTNPQNTASVKNNEIKESQIESKNESCNSNSGQFENNETQTNLSSINPDNLITNSIKLPGINTEIKDVEEKSKKSSDEFVPENSKIDGTSEIIPVRNEPEKSEEAAKHTTASTIMDKSLDELVPERKNELKPNEQEVVNFWNTTTFKIIAVITVIIYIIILNIFILCPTEAKEIMNKFLLF